jgi:hypothetical protein
MQILGSLLSLRREGLSAYEIRTPLTQEGTLGLHHPSGQVVRQQPMNSWAMNQDPARPK